MYLKLNLIDIVDNNNEIISTATKKHKMLLDSYGK